MGYTPKPWRVGSGEPNDLYNGGDVVLCEYKGITRVLCMVNSHFSFADDARLIAASPDLYEACKAALRIVREYRAFGLDGFEAEEAQINAALAKAEGKQAEGAQ